MLTRFKYLVTGCFRRHWNLKVSFQDVSACLSHRILTELGIWQRMRPQTFSSHHIPFPSQSKFWRLACFSWMLVTHLCTSWNQTHFFTFHSFTFEYQPKWTPTNLCTKMSFFRNVHVLQLFNYMKTFYELVVVHQLPDTISLHIKHELTGTKGMWRHKGYLHLITWHTEWEIWNRRISLRLMKFSVPFEHSCIPMWNF